MAKKIARILKSLTRKRRLARRLMGAYGRKLREDQKKHDARSAARVEAVAARYRPYFRGPEPRLPIATGRGRVSSGNTVSQTIESHLPEHSETVEPRSDRF